ncbi:hypothetical protein Z517_08278 [Fonsecaea pedrosoi CBS 271.37]|uniref:DUF1996 domain-containing protein n=1 Tax=Fonsecaea pedrosoi CBS 271.37 TaxID=1442368 RepID=A0A0D2EW21_9EURO|nr:uncharacterized protein Z517_08278 [Fonsecaea pedrosoi CBS 271.37]KIW78442.1 hypothetical protein Z517_08278 [Fonsecaea pedrosoi CBS 271.37]
MPTGAWPAAFLRLLEWIPFLTRAMCLDMCISLQAVAVSTVSSKVDHYADCPDVNQFSTFDSLQTSTCSTCEVQEDKSAYWTPQLYFAHANGSFEEVPNYGMTVYYVGRGGNSSNTVPFPPGFKMITGDTRQRSYDNTTLTYMDTRPVADRVSFRCINEANDIPEEHYMFRSDCVNGMRAQINFQSCWDGVNLYLENSAHVAYLSGIDYGVCPPSHPVPIPGLFFEVLYWTNAVDQSGGGKFVFSNGDDTGYGFHGDFLNGWTMDILDGAVQDCLYTDNGGVVSACSHIAPSDDTNFPRDCLEQPSVFDEPVHGMISALPGCNPITSGPGLAEQILCPLNSHSPDPANQIPVSSSTSTTTTSSSDATTTTTESTMSTTTETSSISTPNTIDAVATSVSSSTTTTTTTTTTSSPSTGLSTSDLPPISPTVTSFGQFTSTMGSNGGLATTTVTEWVTITVTGPNGVPTNLVALSSAPDVTSTFLSADPSLQSMVSAGRSIYVDPCPDGGPRPFRNGMRTITLYAAVTPRNTGPLFSSVTPTTTDTPTPTSASSAFSQVAGLPGTTLTTIATPAPADTGDNMNIAISTSLALADGFPAGISTAFVTTTQSVTETTTMTSTTTSTPVTTPFRIRGREVF